jgi:hypothetical protein
VSDAGLERRIVRLEDLEAIRRLKWRYGLAADDRKDCRVNIERTVELFAAEGVWESNRYGRADGREAIRNLLSKAPARIEWSLHFLQDTGIEIAADRRTARGRWYLMEAARMANPKSQQVENVWITGVYDDEFLRQGGAWLFSRVKLDIQRIVGETGVWD